MLLLPRIERHLRTGRVPPTRFGREALNDPRLVFDLREGRQLRSSTAMRVCVYLDSVEQAELGQ